MVEGVALELLCRLLFTEGSNPSLSVPFNQFTNLIHSNVSKQITMDTIIPRVIPFFDFNIDSLFLIYSVRKILERVDNREC